MPRSFSNSSKTSSKSSLTVACLVAIALSACGGSGGSGGTSPPPPGGGTGTQEVCTATAAEADGRDVRPSSTAPADNLATRKAERVDGNPRGRLLDALWLNASRSGRSSRPDAAAAGRDAIDVGEIAIVQDEGDLIESPNAYDLRNLGLRFTRNGSGGYDVSRIDGAFRTTLGTRLTLTDDDSVPLNVAFGFSFFGQSQTTAFVNSDGNITFEQEDRASTDRNVARLLTGPPRIAPFLADLDPSTGTGRVFGNAAADQYTVTWCGVRGFDSTRTTNAQLTLLPDGSIEMKFGAVTLPEAIVGLSPGRTGEFVPVDLSANGPTGGGGGAVGERFAEQAQLDTVEVARKFYQSHPDNYDQLVIWTDATVVDDAFAYEVTVANEIRGIGLSQFDASRDFGSAGRLRSYAMMDWIGKYPEDPLQSVPGREQHRQRARPGSRSPVARVSRVPEPHRRALGGAPRARPGALELLLRFGRLGDGRQRHRGSRRRLVPHDRCRAALQPARSVRDGARVSEPGPDVLLCRQSRQRRGRARGGFRAACRA